jgi:hypothetical protein
VRAGLRARALAAFALLVLGFALLLPVAALLAAP